MKENIKILNHDPKPIHYYHVNDHDLRTLALGSDDAQIFLNLVFFLLPLGISGIIGLSGSSRDDVYWCLFYMVLSVFGCCGAAVFFALWRRAQKNKRPLLDQILASPISGSLGDEKKELTLGEALSLSSEKKP